jgi:hypothetical protein
MPAVHLNISEVPVIISTDSPCLIKLFADYFRYYNPEIEASIEVVFTSLLRRLEATKTPRECRANFPVCSGSSEGSLEEARANSDNARLAPLVIELKTRRELPPREKLIPPSAELCAKTGVVSLWHERVEDQSAGLRERFYFDLGVAVFHVDPQSSRAIGLVSPQSLEYPHILANTYALFALLLLLRSRGLYHLHAAAVISPQDELCLICGSERSGKTTLTTALGIAGWRPISDDSLLIGFAGAAPRLSALKKYFHIGDELLARWRELDGAARRHRYSDRACVGGLEFFETKRLANKSFKRIDRIILPEITGEPQSRIEPIPRSQAFLKIAEQSMFFQLWPEHTKRQWEALTELAAKASCHRLLAGRDILDDPLSAARTVEDQAA